MDIQINRARPEPERPSLVSTLPRSLETTSNRFSREDSPISWRGVLAGVLVAFLAQLAFTSLGVALGASSLRGVIQGTTRFVGLASGSALWLILSTLLSLYSGGYVAGRLSGPISVRIGQIQGIVISALFFALCLSQIGMTLGLISRGISGAMSTLSQSVGTVSKNPIVQEAIRTTLGKIPLKSPPDQVASELTSRLMSGNRTGARDYLAQQTGLSAKEADAKINQLMGSTGEALKTAGNATASIVSIAGWTLFSALLLGTLFAFLGGGVGVAAHFGKVPKLPSQDRDRKQSAA